MRYLVKIRQERPRVTRAPHKQRFWELYVVNRLTHEYEYHTFALTFDDAINLAEKVWLRSNNVNPAELREATC